jgi:hypothetical protein
MDRPYVIDLNDLSIGHSDEIARMMAAIDKSADHSLWTARLRTSVRGGKPLGGAPLIDDQSSDCDR